MKRSPDMAKAFWNTEISVSVNDTKTKLLQTVRAPRTVTIKPRPEDIPTFGDFLEFVLSTNLLGSGTDSDHSYSRASTQSSSGSRTSSSLSSPTNLALSPYFTNQVSWVTGD